MKHLSTEALVARYNSTHRLALSTPVHLHDCSECTHLGSTKTVDYYHCKQDDSKYSATLIARYSSEPSDYSSGMGFYSFTYHINVAGNLALDHHLITLEELNHHCPVDVTQRIELSLNKLMPL